MYKISEKMTGKLEGINALNTSPVNNEFCLKMSKQDVICKECYSLRMLKTFRKNAEPTFRKNGEILSSVIVPLELVPSLNSAFFRVSAHGELINETHMINVLNIAVKNPHCNVALWTKRKDIINRVFGEMGYNKPDNLIIIFSEPRVNHITSEIPQYFDKIFNVVTPDSEYQNRVNCGAKSCMSCLACYKKDNGKNVIVESMKNQGTHTTKQYKNAQKEGKSF